MSRKKQRKTLLGENFAKAFVAEIDAPSAALSGVSHIELSGNTEAVIQGCAGVLEYSEDCIRLNLGKRTVLFKGSSLVMKSYSVEEVIVEGIFASIEFA